MQLVLLLSAFAVLFGLLTSQYFYLFSQKNNSQKIGKNTLIYAIVSLLITIALIALIIFMLFDNTKQFTVSFNKLTKTV